MPVEARASTPDEWRSFEAAPFAFGVLSRKLDFQFRNPSMSRLWKDTAAAGNIAVSLRAALPALAPGLETLCRRVFHTRTAAKSVPLKAVTVGQRSWYLVDVFPLNTRSEFLVGIVLQDVTCYTLELLALLASRISGQMARLLTDVNRRSLQAQLDMGTDDEAKLFRNLLDRSEQVSLSIRRILNDGRSPLSPRELQVLTMIAEARTSKEIATALSVSEKTVRTHRDRIMRKLDMHDGTTLARYAVRTGLLLA